MSSPLGWLTCPYPYPDTSPDPSGPHPLPGRHSVHATSRQEGPHSAKTSLTIAHIVVSSRFTEPILCHWSITKLLGGSGSHCFL